MTLDLPSVLSMPYTLGMRVLPIVVVGVVMLGVLWAGTEMLNLPDAVCWGAMLITALLAIPLWKVGERSVVEVTEQGVTQRGWDGQSRFFAWSEIARATYQETLGLMTLYDDQGTPHLRFTNQRDSFFTFTLLLAHYCPDVWRLRAPKRIGASGGYGLLTFLVGAGTLRLFQVVWQNPSVVAVLIALGFVGALATLLWMVTGRLTIHPDRIMIERWRQHTDIPLSGITSIGWTLRRAQRTRYYEPTITLADGKSLDVGGFGSSVVLFCTVLRAWLDAHHTDLVVRWGVA